MTFIMRSVIICCLLIGLTGATNYEGYKVYKVTAETEAQNRILLALQKNPNFDFWSRINKIQRPVTLMVTPETQTDFEHVLATQGMSYEVVIDDVPKTILRDREYHESRPKHTKGTRLDTSKYYRYDEINTYLEQVAEQYPEVVTLGTAGQSYEGRDVNYLLISTGNGTGSPKPTIFVDGGIHAREWIAPAVALYLINQLVEVPEHADLIANVDWVVLPAVNPDGYEYSFTDDRFWRKTRSPGLLCDGADANRNFDYHWMEDGASDFECAEDFAGNQPFSEAEARTLRDAILNTRNLVAYLTLHSYGPYFLWPYGYGPVPADNAQELDDLAHAADDAIAKVGGTRYDIGNSAILLYPAAGASDDYSMALGGASIVYTIELPGGGSYGFDLPPSRIAPVVVETFEGIKVIHDHVANRRN